MLVYAFYFSPMEFELPRGRKILFIGDKVPGHLKRYALSFSRCIVYKRFTGGELLTQLVPGTDYSIWLHHFIIKDKTVMSPRTMTSTLALCYMLAGSISYSLKGHDSTTLEESNYQLIYVPGDIFHKVIFIPGIYCCFHINFHHSHLEPIAEQYPFFRPMLVQAGHNFKKGSSQQKSAIAPHIRTLINEIVTCDMGLGERTLFIESRIRDLLRLYVRDQGNRASLDYLSHSQLQVLSDVEQYIVGHFDQDLSVKKLMAVTGTSRSWLQKICKIHYGKALHELVTDKRMSEAALLLLTTSMPVNQIADRVSNMSFPAFSAAFRKYYDQSPTAFRKNRGQTKQK